MKCLYCNSEMKEGEFTTMTAGTDPTMISFIALRDKEKSRFKNLFNKKTIDLSKYAGTAIEAYQCEKCQKIIVTFNI